MNAQNRTDLNAATAPDHEALLNAWFDGGLDESARSEFTRSLTRNVRAARDFAETEALVEALRRGPACAPDFTAGVLAEAERRSAGRAWLDAPARRRVRLGRLAAAAALLLALTGGLLLRRSAPERFSDRPAPLSALIADGRAGASSAATSVAGVFESARSVAFRVRAMVDAADAPGASTPALGEQRFMVFVPVSPGDDLAWAGALATRSGAEPRTARFVRTVPPPRD